MAASATDSGRLGRAPGRADGAGRRARGARGRVAGGLRGARGLTCQRERMSDTPAPPARLPRDVTEEGDGIVVGDGAARIDVFVDFLCPFCKQFEERAARGPGPAGRRRHGQRGLPPAGLPGAAVDQPLLLAGLGGVGGGGGRRRLRRVQGRAVRGPARGERPRPRRRRARGHRRAGRPGRGRVRRGGALAGLPALDRVPDRARDRGRRVRHPVGVRGRRAGGARSRARSRLRSGGSADRVRPMVLYTCAGRKHGGSTAGPAPVRQGGQGAGRRGPRLRDQGGGRLQERAALAPRQA